MDEIFRPIEGYERLYQVSNFGRVKSVDRIDCAGHRLKGRIRKRTPDKNGYLRVCLHKEGKRKNFQVHRLVAHAFIPNPEGLPMINHIDEDKTNNRVDNLEWCDCKYNINYGTHTERQVQTKISNGTYDPEMCGIIKNEGMKEYKRKWWQKNRGRINEQKREQYRLKKKQGKKDNRPSETSLW